MVEYESEILNSFRKSATLLKIVGRQWPPVSSLYFAILNKRTKFRYRIIQMLKNPLILFSHHCFVSDWKCFGYYLFWTLSGTFIVFSPNKTVLHHCAFQCYWNLIRLTAVKLNNFLLHKKYRNNQYRIHFSWPCFYVIPNEVFVCISKMYVILVLSYQHISYTKVWWNCCERGK